MIPLPARRLRVALLAAGSLAAVAGCDGQKEFPQRPIMLICPWVVGGGTDRVSRQVASQLERELGVPVNVVNVTGGGGVTGHMRGALARPDGHTVTMITVELNILHWRGLTNVAYQDFAPLVLLNRDAAALFVRSDAPWSTAAELLADVRRQPGRLRASGTAEGGIWHLALAGWLMSGGQKPDDMTWVSINGAAPSLQELLAGGVDSVCCSLPEARTLVDAGRVRCLGVMAPRRLDEFAEVPTFQEQGLNWSMGGWRGLALPAGTPDPIVEKLAVALARVVDSDEFRRFMRDAGFDHSLEHAATFAETLKKQDQQFGELLGSPAFAAMRASTLGPMVFPAMLAGLGVLLLAGMFSAGALSLDPEAQAVSRRGLLRAAEAVGWLVLYVAAAETVGFLLIASTLLALLMFRLGVRWTTALAATAALVPLVYQVFAVWLRVPLPRGWLGW